ncbi:MAG: GntR family transcriptional regulator [Pseudomonadota bacterium]
MLNAANMCEATGFRRQRPLVLEVRDELERMILDGEVPAGARLNEPSLAAQMGVSRAPVREAARSLERDGLVTTVTNQGVFVRKPSVEQTLELYELRAMIAGLLCGRVAQTSDDETRTTLRARVTQMADAIEAGDQEDYAAQNTAFHDQIAQAAGTHRATELYVALGKEVRLLRLRSPDGVAAMRASNAEHDRIVAAIEIGDAETARLEGSQHHLNGKARLLELLDRTDTTQT